MQKHEILKEQIMELTKEYYKEKYINTKKPFQSGDRINYAGRVFGEEELINLVDSGLEFWLTAGRYTEEFESEFAKYIGVNYCSLVNSGSSANLLAFMALTSSKLGDRQIKKGDEVITVAAGFPTTIAPIIQYGSIPVFVDVTIPEYNIDITKLEDAISDKTKAVMIAHTLGNPFNLQYVRDFCDKYGLWLIEDNCDALGSKYYFNGNWRLTGSIGHIGTSSFYPPHHITMGEGGAVYTDDSLLKQIIDSFRDWGRDCWCPPGSDGTCKQRYTQQFGELPIGYDHKYVYSNFGYNMKATDMQAAIGCAQLKRIELFGKARRYNWNLLREGLEKVSDKLILPEKDLFSDPSWFGFLITVRKEASFTRDELADYLESNNIQTRNLFAGNIVKHPCFDELRKTKMGYRISGTLDNTDKIMNDSLWIGTYPGLSEEMIQAMITAVTEFCMAR